MKLRNELQERLEILHSAGMIEDSVVVLCEKTVDLILKEVKHPSTEKMEIFVTHLAMALHRILQDEIEADIDSAILTSLQEEPVFETANTILTQIEQFSNMKFPDSERHLLLIHVCNICKVQ